MLQERSLKTINVCPDCGSRHLHRIEYKTYGYWLCYCCGWSSLTPKQIGEAMAKESMKKLKLNLDV